MIKNIFFDFGQVLVYFIPYDLTKAYVDNENDIKIVEEVLFDRLYWDKLDAGTITDEEVVEAVKKRLPNRLHELAENAYYNWIYNITEVEGMSEIVKKLKRKGINLCILSNISKYFAKHYKEVPILQHFDRFIFSAEIGLVKPQKDIFEYALKNNGFIASETLFIDDRENNVLGAKSVGINGYVFDGDSKKLSEYLKSIGLL
ncbi:MAG: HAD family phosphatase [Clostridiales bacterium]|nr:HAD family phosphatase [Clostridiales bacterium]